MEARLLEMGLRWSEVGYSCDWQDIISALESEPPWGPIHRAKEPKNWLWGLPGYDELVSLLEMTAAGNVQRGNQSGAKKSEFPKRIRRPWDERDTVNERKLGGTKVSLEEMDRLLEERMA